ncbi:MAG: efflux RND transporter periplasmic adaptor subunit [Burkholderiaceae bacterium]
MRSLRAVVGAALAALLGFALFAGLATLLSGRASAQAGPAAGESPRVLLIPAQETTLVSQMVGRIVSLGGGLGDAFRSGSTLVRFDCGENNARLKMAQAELNSANQNLQAKQRLKALSAAGDVEVALAEAAVSKARAQIELASVQIRLCTVSAPFTGRIAKLHVRAFQGVNVGQPLIDIVASGALKLRLNVPSRWLRWLKKGAAFEVTIDETGRRYPATVTALNARVDAVSQSVEIEGAIKGSFPELLAGMSGNARFAGAAGSTR